MIGLRQRIELRIILPTKFVRIPLLVNVNCNTRRFHDFFQKILRAHLVRIRFVIHFNTRRFHDFFQKKNLARIW